MTDEQLAAIRARVQSATPAPWFANADVEAPGYYIIRTDGHPLGHWWGDIGCNERLDAEFVAHAREDVPALLAELDAQREARAKDRDAYEVAREARIRRLAGVNAADNVVSLLAARAAKSGDLR